MRGVCSWFAARVFSLETRPNSSANGEVRLLIKLDQQPSPIQELTHFLQLLEQGKAATGIRYYSVSKMRMEDVFLAIVSANREWRQPEGLV